MLGRPQQIDLAVKTIIRAEVAFACHKKDVQTTLRSSSLGYSAVSEKMIPLSLLWYAYASHVVLIWW